MKYMSFIFENQDIRNTVANSEALVEVASANIINTNMLLEAYIYENLVDFTAGTETAHEVYERIRDFVISENSIAYSQMSEILADTELSEEDKLACLNEGRVGDWISQIKPALSNVGEKAKATFDSMKASAGEALGKSKATLGTAMQHGIDAVKAHPVSAGAAGVAALGAAGAGAYAMSSPDSPAAENFASAVDTVKGLASAHPYTAAAIGAGGAGLGAYGIYKAMKAKKPS